MKQTIAMLLAAGSLFAGAAEIGGVRVDDAVKVAGQDLSLNGGGIRYKWGVAKVYVGALYTAQKVSNGDAVIADAKPRRITLTLLRNVPTDKLHDSLIDGLEANCSEAELAALQPRIKELNAIFQSAQEVKQGEMIAIDFLPGKGTQITMRGQVKDVIAGDDFARALLKVWLGKSPASDSLKSNLLGSK